MRHSQKIALVLLGSVSAISLTACDDKPKDGDPIYESADQCKSMGGTNCDDRWYKAMSDHVSTAPKYNDEQSCIARGHERCTSVTGPGNSGNIWLPAMVGFMAGRMTADTRPVYFQGYNSPTNAREREDRRVMAGGYHGGGGATTPVMVGNYYGGGSSYDSGRLGSGMNQGAARAGWNVKPASPGAPAASSAGTVARTMPTSVSRASVPSSGSSAVSTSSASRGGFGGSGAGMGSSGGG
jgi:uncharacterized protein YgiB involved in biofilm formation